MSRTQKGIIYPDNYSDVADIPAAMKDMAESIDDIIVNDKNYVHIQNAASNRCGRTASSLSKADAKRLKNVQI